MRSANVIARGINGKINLPSLAKRISHVLGFCRIGKSKGEEVMTDSELLAQIKTLVEEEHRLENQPVHDDAEQARMAQLEVALDQCWDLLRQRRARREFGQNPDDAQPRDPKIVEHFQQ